MGKRKIALEVKGSKEEVLPKLQSALKKASYKIKIKSKGQMFFKKGSFQGQWPLAKPHKLRVILSPSKFGITISIIIEVGYGEPKDDLDAIENYIRNLLDSSFQVANPLIKGIVSDDGKKLNLIGDNDEISIGPFENRFVEHNKNFKRFAIFSFFFFGIIFIGYIYDLIFNVSGTAYLSEAPYFITFLLFWVLMGPMMWMYFLRSKKRPNKLLPTFEGIYVYYYTKPTIFIPWNQVISIKVPRGFSTPGIFWKTDDGKEEYVVMMKPALEYVIELHNAILKGFDKLYATPAYQAFGIVPPKTKVAVTRKPLSNEEIVYHKLARRFLSSGPLIPVYISNEDHVKLAKDYLNKSDLNKQELGEVAKEATIQKLWNFGAELYERLVKDHPDEEEFNNNLAGCLLEVDRIQDGIKAIDTYLNKHPNSSRCNVMKAILAMKIQRIDEALHHIGRAVELDPNNIQALNFWFEIVGNQSGTAQAISELDYLTTKYPEAWGPHIVLGYKALNSGQIEEAQRYMNKAYEIEINEETVIGLAVALYVKQDIDEMIKIYVGYGEDKTLPPQMIINLAEGYFKRGESHKAFEMLERIDYSMGIEWVDAADDLLMIIHKSV